MSSRNKILFFTLAIQFWGIVIFAINPLDSTRKYNRIIVSKGYNLIYQGRSIVPMQDTIVFIPVESDFVLKKNARLDSILQNFSDKARNNIWTRTLHDIVLVAPDKKSKRYLSDLADSSIQLKYPVIARQVTIRRYDVFGPPFLDTSLYRYSILETFGNYMHVNSKESILKKYLLFQKGNRVSNYELNESERLLRDVSFIQDAKILVINYSLDGDSADILVMVKDSWSKGLDIKIEETNNGTVEMWDNNIAGYGNTNSYSYQWEPENRPANSMNGYMKIDNILGSYINLRLGYSLFGNQDYYFSARRDFYTSKAKYAGQFFVHKFNGWLKWYPINSEAYYTQVAYNNFDIWFGRSFLVRNQSKNSESDFNIVLAMRFMQDNYYQIPTITKDSYFDFQSKKMIINGLSFAKQNFTKLKLVYSFGRNEDIPSGVLLNFVNGFESGLSNIRYYQGVRLSAGSFLRNVGYLYGSTSFGTFFLNQENQQTVFKSQVYFFTNLIVIDRFKSRLFGNIEYTLGTNRFTDELLSLRDRYGIRGFTSDSTKGLYRLKANFENVVFTPFYVANFRFAFFSFADLGLIGNSVSQMFKNGIYSGLGIGLRIRNERLVLNAIQIRLAYYPVLPGEPNQTSFNIRTESKYSQGNFFVREPEVIQYK